VRAVVVIPDNDLAGEKHAQAVAASCHGAGLTLALLRLPGLPPMRDKHGEDVSDWLDAAHSADELRALIEAAPIWTPAAVPLPAQSVRPVGEPEPPLTDRGNAERFARAHRRVVRYCAERGYLVWDGKRFRPDPVLLLALPLAKVTARRFLERTMAAAGVEKARIKWALYSESQPGLRRTLELAQSEDSIPVAVGDLDAEPFILNAANGIVDLTNGMLGPHDPARLCTRITPVAYDAAADCPRFKAFLHRIFRGREALTDYTQRLLGMASTGATDAVLAVLNGGGGNGKTSLVKIVRGVLGSDYSGDTPAETLLVKRREGGIPSDLARLAGLRCVHAAELEGRRLSEATVKQVTGGDPVPARFLHREWFEYTPGFTLLLTCNRLPRITGTDHAIWRRVHVIPFDVTIAEREQVRDFATQLVTDEGPGILAWLVQGAIAWQRAGRLIAPEDVLLATGHYRQEQDSLAPFLAECCALDPAGRIPVAELYTVYTTWARESGETILSKSELRRALVARGLAEPVRGTGGARLWCGIRRKASEEPEPATTEDLTLWN
jgi:putative DNA primase/helicase